MNKPTDLFETIIGLSLIADIYHSPKQEKYNNITDPISQNPCEYKLQHFFE